MEMQFKDLPLSYRLAQGGIAGCLFAWFTIARSGFHKWPENVKWIVVGVVVAIAVFSLVVASYVIVRYPYLSLVPTNDFFATNTSQSIKPLGRVLGCLSLFVFTMFFIVCVLNIAGVMAGGMNRMQLLFAVIYLPLMIGFVGFLTLFYSLEKFPVVATFIHVTLGIGILFFPLYLPAIFIGSVRCKALLDDEIARQEFETMD